MELERISKHNIQETRKIKVLLGQQRWIATIDESLIQASFLDMWNGFVIRVDQKVIGFASYAKYEKTMRPSDIKIYKIMIDENYQGRGYGSTLLDLIIKKIRQSCSGLSSSHIYIDVHTENIAAKKIYMRKGFREFGQGDDTITLLYQFDLVY